MSVSRKLSLLGASVVALSLAFAAPEKAYAIDLFGDRDNGSHNWSGLYIGGQAGYAWGDTNVRFGPGLFGNTEIDPEGFLGGGHIGYNWQVQDVVFGLVGDINFANLDDSGSNLGIGLADWDYDMELTGSIRVKLGLAVDRAMFYTTAGVAIAEFDSTTSTVGVTSKDHPTVYGITVGGGVEYAFTDLISAFVEGRYTYFGDESDSGGGIVNPRTHTIRYGQVVGGVSFKIGDWLGGGN